MEIIPKIKLGFYFSDILKNSENIHLCKFENRFILESIYSYCQFDSLKNATKEFKEWVKSEKDFKRGL